MRLKVKLYLGFCYANNSGGRKLKEVRIQDEIHISGLVASI